MYGKEFFFLLTTLVIFLNASDNNNGLKKNSTRFRFCCRENKVYNLMLRDCVDNINDEINIYKIIRDKFLNKNISFDVIRGAPICQYALVDKYINKNNISILSDGKLQALIKTTGGLKNITLNNENSCIDVENSNQLVVRYCSEKNYCDTNVCIRKCCPPGEIQVKKKCQNITSELSTYYVHQALENTTQIAKNKMINDVLSIEDYGLLTSGPLICKGKNIYPILPEENWHISSLGHLYLPNIITDNNMTDYKIYKHHQHCIEAAYNLTHYENGIYPFICFDESEVIQEPKSLRFIVNGILAIISCIFLFLTFIIYAYLPGLRNLYGKTMMCHIASLFMAYVCLAITGLGPPKLEYTIDYTNDKSWNFCKTIGFLMLYFFVAAFTWLNIMSYDIWSTVGGHGYKCLNGTTRSEKKQFFIYNFYAWGLAFIITSFAIIANHEDTATYLRPDIGLESCWFNHDEGKYGELIFFIAPVSLQLLTNIVFFILTARYCSRIKSEMSEVTMGPRSRRLKADREILIMNIKLFIVMGMTWILEIISNLMTHYVSDFTLKDELLSIGNVINALQGLIIFLLFIVKKKIYISLKYRLGFDEPNEINGQFGLHVPNGIRKNSSTSTLMSTSGKLDK